MSRPACLASCFLVSLACGTLYGFSGYAPQLSDRLGFTARQISAVAMAGNMSMAFSGPFAGALVDRRGFIIPVIVSAITTFTGYSLIRVAYVNAISSIPLLAGALILIGCGATFAFSSSVKCAAVNFPDVRGFATAVAMAGYGLSAFVMSTLARRWTDGPEGMLSLLSFLPATLLIVFGPVVIANEPKPSKLTAGVDDDYIGLVEIPRLTERVAVRGGEPDHPQSREVFGRRLLRSPAFWAYTLLLGSLAGLGQSYIYTCGYMVKALAINVDEHTAQAQQVAILSISNCVGRITSGALSDGVQSCLRLSRTWTLLLAGIVCMGAQIGAATISSLAMLSLPTAMAGFFYGAIFGCFPGIISDTFGVKHLSSNWGLVALSPVPFAYLLTLRVGAIYDSHTSDGVCMGAQCFRSAFGLHMWFTGAWFVLLGFTLHKYAKPAQDPR